MKRKYFRQRGTQSWVFSAKVKAKDESIGYLDLFDAASVEIRRHIKVKADAVAYNPAYSEYFNQRTFVSRDVHRAKHNDYNGPLKLDRKTAILR